jgi:hypothetical protein
MIYNKHSFFIVLLLALLTWGCAGSKKARLDAVGEWKFTVTDTPEGNYDGTIMIYRSAQNQLTGTLRTDKIETALNDLQLDDDHLSASFEFMGFNVRMDGTLMANTFDGSVQVDDQSFPMRGVRIK